MAKAEFLKTYGTGKKMGSYVEQSCVVAQKNRVIWQDRIYVVQNLDCINS